MVYRFICLCRKIVILLGLELCYKTFLFIWPNRTAWLALFTTLNSKPCTNNWNFVPSNSVKKPILILNILRNIEGAQKEILHFVTVNVFDNMLRRIVKETQRFGDISVSFFKRNAAVRTVSGGSFRQRWPLYMGNLQTKPVSTAHYIRLLLSLSEDGDKCDPLEAVRFLAWCEGQCHKH